MIPLALDVILTFSQYRSKFNSQLEVPNWMENCLVGRNLYMLTFVVDASRKVFVYFFEEENASLCYLQ
jgi:hypothetical protein